jgi:hypothetical protein
MVVYNGLDGSDVSSPLEKDSITVDPNFLESLILLNLITVILVLYSIILIWSC